MIFCVYFQVMYLIALPTYSHQLRNKLNYTRIEYVSSACSYKKWFLIYIIYNIYSWHWWGFQIFTETDVKHVLSTHLMHNNMSKINICKEKWLKQHNFDLHWKTTKANYVTFGVRGMILFRAHTAWRKLWRSKLSFRQSFIFELKYWVASMLCWLQLPTFNNDSVNDVIV